MNHKSYDFDEYNVKVAKKTKALNDLIKTAPSSVVYFYSKSKDSDKLMGMFVKTSASFNEEGSKELFVVADLDKDPSIKATYGIESHSTIIYYKKGVEVQEFLLPRSSPNLRAFVQDPTKQFPPMGGPGDWAKVQSQIYHLNSRNFSSFLDNHPKALVLFYSPNCGHCVKAKPAFAESSMTVVERGLGVFGAVDCSSSRKICEKYDDIKGFPTFLLFTEGSDKPLQYPGDRSAADLVSWFEKPTPRQPKAKEEL
eukprot:gene7444-8710_t